jgi:diguanylate cyclase (GGDEF)-like protein
MAQEQPLGGSAIGGAIAEAARTTIRKELGEAIPGLTERDRFLQRAAQLVAHHAGQSLVAIYTRGVAGGDFVLRASTLPPSAPAPSRLSGSTNGRASVIRSAHGSNNAALIANLREGNDSIGALVIFQEHGGFSPADQAIVETVAEEIAPAVAVAERHHAVKQSSVLDLASGAYTTWFFKQRLEEEIERARRQHRDVTVLLLTIQGAERLWSDADMLGCMTLPRDLANVLSSSIRMFDVVAHRAPAEFAIMLVDSQAASASIVIERVESRVLRALQRTPSETGDIAVVTSYASYPADGEDASALLLTAEHRLDEALRQHHPIPTR